MKNELYNLGIIIISFIRLLYIIFIHKLILIYIILYLLFF